MSQARWGLLLVLAVSALVVPVGSQPRPMSEEQLAAQRERMVAEQIAARDVSSARVLDAMRLVPRHVFLPEWQWADAYQDHPVMIGEGQTMSQPYIVAKMTELLDLDGSERVLEIGTGSGYHAAVLSRLAAEVYSIEIKGNLARAARAALDRLGYRNVTIRVGDGYQGWPDAAPFDCIVLTAAPREIPPPLLAQLELGGLLVAPVGGDYVQDLQLITRTDDGLSVRNVIPVRFVPMIGEAEKPH